MAVDDATVNSQQIPKETPHRRLLKANVNDTGETLISDMLKLSMGQVAQHELDSEGPMDPERKI